MQTYLNTLKHMNQSKLYIFSCLISYRVQATERDCCTHILSTEFNTIQLHNLNNNLNYWLKPLNIDISSQLQAASASYFLLGQL